jgi:hypothetical protein
MRTGKRIIDVTPGHRKATTMLTWLRTIRSHHTETDDAPTPVEAGEAPMTEIC